jgi:phospholipid/cholesterol/gamma-HCH transport system substrate-binding protein
VKNTEAKVGALVVLSVIILCATVYFVGNAQYGRTRTPYRVRLRYAGGLAPGTDVLFGGITVGKVKAVKPDSTDPTLIEVSLEIKDGTPVNAKSVAKLGSVSLMSAPVVSITTGSNDAPRLQAGALIPSQETVSMDDMQRQIAAIAQSAQGLIASLQVDLNNITGDARQVLANVNDLTGDTNRRHVANVLANTDATIAQARPRIDQITANFEVLSQQANQVMAKLGPTVDNINATVSNANGAVTAFRNGDQPDLQELQKTLIEARGLIENLHTLVRANEQNVSYTLENVRMATDHLNDLTESVNERPWSLIRISQPKDRTVPQQ